MNNQTCFVLHKTNHTTKAQGPLGQNSHERTINYTTLNALVIVPGVSFPVPGVLSRTGGLISRTGGGFDFPYRQ